MLDNYKKIIGIVMLLGIVGFAVYTFFIKKEEGRKITYSTSDAGNLKGEYAIALDSWVGYFPLRSPVFGKLMRDAGYRIKIIDDNADYSDRMKMLKKGKVDFAVCTVDSYLLNGTAKDYPAAIVAIIDESKGGDAIVAWKDKFADLDDIKKAKSFNIAFTPASPSEHLLKAISVHFGINRLKGEDTSWRVETDGAEEAYKKLIDREVDIAVLWEPHVSEALSKPGIIKLMGSEDTEKLIVDILLVNRKFAKEKSGLVKLFLRKYFETLTVYSASPGRLKQDILTQVDLSKGQISSMLKGVKWVSYPENLKWFGLSASRSHQLPEIIESINSTISILLMSGDFNKNPLTDNDPYTIINSQFVNELYNSIAFDKSKLSSQGSNSLTKRFKKLSPEEWGRLKKVGALKLRPITFRSGTSIIDDSGSKQMDEIAGSIRHYPNFRIYVKGHTGLRGDQTENIKLSLKRSEAVKKNLQYTYNIDSNRIMVVGMGSKEPLPRKDGESSRAFNSRLKRVEILFLSP